MQTTKAALLLLEDQQKAVSWEYEVLLQRYSRVEKERDELYAKFHSSIYEVQQKSGFKVTLVYTC